MVFYHYMTKHGKTVSFTRQLSEFEVEFNGFTYPDTLEAQDADILLRYIEEQVSVAADEMFGVIHDDPKSQKKLLQLFLKDSLREEVADIPLDEDVSF